MRKHYPAAWLAIAVVALLMDKHLIAYTAVICANVWAAAGEGKG
jgi:hypothetical protein